MITINIIQTDAGLHYDGNTCSSCAASASSGEAKYCDSQLNKIQHSTDLYIYININIYIYIYIYIYSDGIYYIHTQNIY